MKPKLIVMGPSGCGKTTLARAVGARAGIPWADGDDYHDAAAIAKMSRGDGLTDEDRWPWFQRIADAMSEDVSIMACSALKKDYRDWLRGAVAGVRFVFPEVSTDELRARLISRDVHYAGASLLESQLSALEPPRPRADVLRIAPGTDVAVAVDTVLSWSGLASPTDG